MRKNVIILLLIVAVGVITFLAYRYGIREGRLQMFDPIGPEVAQTTDKVDDEVILPSCEYGMCPVYVSADVDGDSLSESVVRQPTAMTKGAAMVLIIKDNKIVFSTGGAQFSYKINSETNEGDTGITTRFVDEWDETGLRPKTWLVEKWIYKNNDYVLDSKQVIPFKKGDL